MPSRVEELEAFAAEVHAAGFDRCLLMGMGGSSLAADVLRRLPRGESGLELRVLDTTDPAQVQAAAEWCTQGTALYIVSSKSGTTAEPLALLEYFWERTGSPSAGDRGASFVAITDPGTPLESVARDRGFRRAFAGDPRVGGRYSALSVFGLVPATLLGLDLGAIAQRVRHTASACGPSAPVERNPGAFLGAILGAGARQGRDKVTFLADEPVAPLAEWIEQLLAESTGKQGRGLVPVVGEPVGSAGSYGADRLFVYLRSTGELDPRVKPWAKAGIPVAVVETGADAAGLAASFFEWEMAVAVACHLMGVNAFDQPDVERAKKRTTDLLSEYQRQGSLPQPDELWRGEGVVLLGRESDGVGSQASLREFAGQLLEIARQGRGLTLLAYLPRSEELDRTVAELRKALRDQFGMATAFGYGPRYLHSTGQLHKGGADGALYLIFTAEPEIDAEVPGAGYTFKTLQRAQAWGDLLALQDLNRQAFGLHLDRPGRALELIGTLRGAAQRARRESVRPGS
jgi:glucose-6-phosphate isomerase